MRIAVRNFQDRPIIERGALRGLVELALRETGRRADAVAFAFVDDAGMSDHHERFSGVPGTTDVLAFVADPDPGGESELGDVVVCTDQARRQALCLGHAYGSELRVLALHGLLHLLGYDHAHDRGEMQALEERLRPRILGGRGAR